MVEILALTEQVAVLPAAVVAYAAAWWTWGLADPSTRISEEETR